MRNHSNPKHTVAVIGAGPAGLMATEILLAHNVLVDLFEAKPTIGRKFLMAGKSGLNLTHSEHFESFLNKFTPKQILIENSLRSFTPEMVRCWVEGLGIETFIGSSGRLFPRAMKASPLLRSWHTRLSKSGLKSHLNHKWEGPINSRELEFSTPTGIVRRDFDAVILALGGASWPQLGSNGNWVKSFRKKGVEIEPFLASNCGFDISWSDVFKNKFSGTPVKSCVITVDNKSIAGDFVITDYGIEGTPIYSHSELLQKQISKNGFGLLSIDLAPDRSLEDLEVKLSQKTRKLTISNHIRKNAQLSQVKIGLLREFLRLEDFHRADLLAKAIKQLKLTTNGSQPIGRAISSSGGIKFTSVETNLMLKAMPGIFVAGEMLDWNAPTGGYLINACLALGRTAGFGAADWLSY